MAVCGRVAIIIAIFFNHVHGRHECERPCTEDAEPKECYYHFTLTFEFQKCVHVKSEECRRRIALSVNGQSPGPLINVCRGDIVTVDVKNSLPFGMEASIHWHGLDQRGSPFMDGVSMITQCPIHTGTTFRYRIRLDESGTYYYHAHSVQQQLDGLYGALVVREDTTTEEKILLIAPQFDQVASLLAGLVTDLSSPELKTFTYTLEGEDHLQRMRLINAAAIDCPLSITGTRQKLKIAAVDGHKVKPIELTHLFLYPGERVDITSGFDFEITGRNLCDGQKIPGNLPVEKSHQKYDLIDYYNSLSSAAYEKLEKESFRIYLPFRTATYSHSDNPVDFRYKLGEIVHYVPAYINGNTDVVSIQQFQNITFLYPSSPLLTQENDINQNLFCSSGNKAKTCYPNNFCECLHILTLPFNETVDLIIIDGGNSSQGKEQTFHLHGNKVKVLKIASFEHAISAREVQNALDSGAVQLKLLSPVAKDTVAVPKMGYVILRLKTDNPGYWLLESIPSKAESGMGLELVLYTPGVSGHSIPKGFPRCKSVKPPDLEDLDKDQIALLKKAFDAFDQEKRGYISTNMVGTILSMLGHAMTESMLADVIAEVDADRSGELEFNEFCTLAARFLVEEDAEAMQQELKEAFRLYDKEGNGYITTTVLREILRELDDKITAEELDLMISEIDSDGSGTVDFDEFMEVMTGGDD